MPSIRKTVIAALIASVAFACSEAALRSGLLDFIEAGHYDSWHLLAGKRTVPSRTAIVAVDEGTLSAYPDEPLVFWSPYFARSMEVLREVGAAPVGLDLIFSVSPEAWITRMAPDNEASRLFDRAFREQLGLGMVVLAGDILVTDEGAGLLLPHDDYLLSLPRGLADIGLTRLLPDHDGVVRSFVPAYFPPDQPPSQAFGALLATLALQSDAPGLHTQEPGRIRFTGPPGTIPTVSMSALLAPDALERPEVQALKGRVVIIAADFAGDQDRHQTPYARGFFSPGHLMRGAEIHANVVETLLGGIRPEPVPDWLRLGVMAALLLIAQPAFLSLPPVRGAALGLGLAGLAWLAGYRLFLADMVLPNAPMEIGLGMSYLGAVGFRLTRGERDRARIRHLFARYVSPEAVDAILRSGHSPALGGEEVEVTVLFSDIRNFTTISEKLTAPEVVEMLNNYFSRACEPILARGGMVDKFIGDAVMAVFGAPAPCGNHAKQAVLAAIGMVDAAVSFREWMHQRFPGLDLPEFGIGVGLHTGHVVLGNIGSTRRTEFTVIGDTVNTASRLESATKELKAAIAASDVTVTAAGPGVVTGKEARMKLKGRAAEVLVLEIVGLQTESEKEHCNEKAA